MARRWLGIDLVLDSICTYLPPPELFTFCDAAARCRWLSAALRPARRRAAGLWRPRCSAAHWAAGAAPAAEAEVALRTLERGPGPLRELAQLDTLVTAAASLFRCHRSVLAVPGPCLCVGSIHGSPAVLLAAVREWRREPERSLLLLGSVANSGPNSVEVLRVICALKILHPSKVLWIRGEHDDADKCEALAGRREALWRELDGAPSSKRLCALPSAV
eukprot:TRINITY_DN43196_c0_g1_i1.p3 TRINITY_DN43196_c0_g1~~TRINITY_DN43196_c0_g1_i1.p3  ORF type:complete len:239 (+),score=67.33 TRINITY_DN43196_c0_g1_i1:66-719(+)